MAFALSIPEAEWMEANQGKHLCACGCGKAIRINRHQRYARKIPKYYAITHKNLHWVKQHQGKHFCHCGCGEAIKILPQHKNGRGIPKYIKHHNSEDRKTVDRWVEANQNKHICACGCERFIEVTKWMRDNKLPKFIHGHAKGLPLDIWVKQEQGKHICKCGCDGEIPIRREHRGHHIPEYILGHNAIGKTNPSWRGGITPAYQKERKAFVAKGWREAVLKRDGHQCQMPWCTNYRRTRKLQLHVHHIIGFTKDKSRRSDVSNGITLCQECHYGIKGRESENEDFLFALLG